MGSIKIKRKNSAIHSNALHSSDKKLGHISDVFRTLRNCFILLPFMHFVADILPLSGKLL
jgi:hypothetical protein